MQPNDPYQENSDEQPKIDEPQVFVGDHQKVVEPVTAVKPDARAELLAAADNVAPTESSTVYGQVASPVATPPAIVSNPTSAPLPTQSFNTKATKKHGGVFKKMAMGLVVVAVFAAGFAANSGVSALNAANAKSAGKAMVAALIAGNSAKAYSLASPDLKSQQTAEALLQSVGDVQTTKGSFSSQNIQVNGDNAVYVANVGNLPPNDSSQTNGVFVVSLARHGVSGWKVDDVSVQ